MSGGCTVARPSVESKQRMEPTPRYPRAKTGDNKVSERDHEGNGNAKASLCLRRFEQRAQLYRCRGSERKSKGRVDTEPLGINGRMDDVRQRTIRNGRRGSNSDPSQPRVGISGRVYPCLFFRLDASSIITKTFLTPSSPHPYISVKLNSDGDLETTDDAIHRRRVSRLRGFHLVSPRPSSTPRDIVCNSFVAIEFTPTSSLPHPSYGSPGMASPERSQRSL